jgi:hypothetical protein
MEGIEGSVGHVLRPAEVPGVSRLLLFESAFGERLPLPDLGQEGFVVMLGAPSLGLGELVVLVPRGLLIPAQEFHRLPRCSSDPRLLAAGNVTLHGLDAPQCRFLLPWIREGPIVVLPQSIVAKIK